MKIRVLSVLVAVVLVIPVGVSVAQDPAVAETFDDPTLPGWEVENAVITDGALRVHPGGLAFHPLPGDDFALHIRVRRSGQGDALIHYRAGETGNYAVRLGEGFAAVQRHHGPVDEIAREPATSTSGAWVSLTIVVRGPDHTIMVDDQPVIELSDPQSFEGGGVVLRVEDDAPVEFDDLVVEAFDLSTTTTTTIDATIANTDGSSWIRTGGPIGGLGYDVRMHPDNPDLMYVTDAFAGVFISEDGGDTWVPSNNGITTRTGPSGDGIPVFCLTIDPNEPDTVWVGTQGTRGIFKSVDGGQTWVEEDEGVIESEGIS
ncbi:MAG: family 16 glycoside hydrolase, partial [Actinomycetota bacterium]|nr:family 16 glycoside hydrolase [Actinomycetota bacterium]